MLAITDLAVRIGPYEIVRIEALDVPAGRRLGLVGESGSGKTMTSMSIVGLQPRDAVLSGSVRFHGRELVGLSDGELAAVRGAGIGLIPQDPTRALNPTMRIGRQLAEAIRLHADLSRAALRARSIDLLSKVRLPDAAGMLRRYPHQLSGGQLQRVAVARALSVAPDILYADEPTSALDVSVQAQVLNLLMDLRDELGLGLVMVSHDLAVVSRLTERLIVMKDGRVVEVGTTADVLDAPRHAYTAALIEAARSVSLDSHRVSIRPPAGSPPGSLGL